MENQIVPYEHVERMAMAIAKSGLFGAKTPEQALALMLVAQAEGLHPATAARDYDIIQGRPAKKSEAMMRTFLQNGGTVKWNKLDDTCADATFSHPQGGTVTITWDMARVVRAKISNPQMYEKYPRQMLRSRCVSEGIRTVCPMATSGMYNPDEIVDNIKDADVVQEERPKISRVESIVCSEQAAASEGKPPVDLPAVADTVKPAIVAAPLPLTAPAPEVIPTKATGVVIGQIAEMQSKSGLKKDKTPWTKWAVKVDGSWFGTFSDTVSRKLTDAKDKNTNIQIYFSTRVDGEKKYNDIEAVMEISAPAVVSEEDMVI